MLAQVTKIYLRIIMKFTPAVINMIKVKHKNLRYFNCTIATSNGASVIEPSVTCNCAGSFSPVLVSTNSAVASFASGGKLIVTSLFRGLINNIIIFN